MSQYDGLNLPELLDLMHELVLPEPIPWLPQTPGWWIAFGWFFAVLLVSGRYWMMRRRRNRYRRDALAELKAIETAPDLGPTESAQQIATLLKRTALVAYPRRDVASIFGKDWAEFLTESANDDKQIAAAAESLAAAAYRPDAIGDELVQAARRWIRLHHA